MVSAPVASQNIPRIVGVAGNAVAISTTTGSYAVAYYKNTNTAGNRWTYHNAAPDSEKENQETLTNFIAG